MARYQGILAYDGTRFHGFQRQVNAATVQGVVEAALHRIGWRDRTVLAAGRTDAGVHASGQVVSFELDWEHSEGELLAALNTYLPASVAFRGLRQVASDFHPRYDAISRRYRYRIYIGIIRDPLWERYAWRVWPEASLELLQQAARALLGTHDFAAFGLPPKQGGSTVRSVTSAEWEPYEPCESSGDQIRVLDFEITANGFLNRMVRRLVNLQVLVGQGMESLAVVSELLESPPAQVIQGLAPPNGLTLVEVTYPE